MEGFSFDFNGDELEYFSWFPPRETGLAYDIFIDAAKRYEKYHHPLCLYVKYGENTLVPYLIDTNPSAVGNIIPVDSNSIVEWIKAHYDGLVKYGNMEIPSEVFYDMLDNDLLNT